MDRTITAIATLLWPLLILAALIVYRRPLGRVLRSAERREWTIEIAGQKLSMGQVREQQTALISDLQRQLGTLRRDLDTLRHEPYLPSELPPVELPQGPGPVDQDEDSRDSELTYEYPEPAPWGAPTGPAPERAEYPPDPWGPQSGPASQPPSGPASPAPPTGPPPQAPVAPPPTKRRRQRRRAPSAQPPMGYGLPGTGVLWVDDHPENNAILIDSLQRDGVRIDIALSTDEGLARRGRHHYAAVISDMGRTEEGKDVPDAGLRLLEAVRRTDPTLPFIIYCGERTALAYRDRALAAGATEITASPAEVVTQLQRLQVV